MHQLSVILAAAAVAMANPIQSNIAHTRSPRSVPTEEPNNLDDLQNELPHPADSDSSEYELDLPIENPDPWHVPNLPFKMVLASLDPENGKYYSVRVMPSGKVLMPLLPLPQGREAIEQAWANEYPIVTSVDSVEGKDGWWLPLDDTLPKALDWARAKGLMVEDGGSLTPRSSESDDEETPILGGVPTVDQLQQDVQGHVDLEAMDAMEQQESHPHGMAASGQQSDNHVPHQHGRLVFHATKNPWANEPSSFQPVDPHFLEQFTEMRGIAPPQVQENRLHFEPVASESQPQYHHAEAQIGNNTDDWWFCAYQNNQNEPLDLRMADSYRYTLAPETDEAYMTEMELEESSTCPTTGCSARIEGMLKKRRSADQIQKA